MINIVFGEITKPKCDTIINFTNKYCIPHSYSSKKILDFGGPTLAKDIEKQLKQMSKIKIGDSYFTCPGRLNRRGIRQICHVVIMDYCNSFVNINTFENIFDTVFSIMQKLENNSVGVCCDSFYSSGIDMDLLVSLVANKLMKSKLDFDLSIIDEDKEFINLIKNHLEIMKVNFKYKEYTDMEN